MTRREATLQILIEVTAQPEAHLKKVIEHLPVGGPVDWDAEMTTEERPLSRKRAAFWRCM